MSNIAFDMLDMRYLLYSAVLTYHTDTLDRGKDTRQQISQETQWCKSISHLLYGRGEQEPLDLGG